MEKPNEPRKTIENTTPVELARMLQKQFQTISAAQQKIMQCQQNIWTINAQLDKIEANNEEPDEGKEVAKE